LAAARGASSRLEFHESLLAHRAELESVQASEQDLTEAWLKEIAGLQGERIFWSTFPHDIYAIAAPRVEAGERWSFAPGSLLMVVGGTKGHDLTPDWMDTVTPF